MSSTGSGYDYSCGTFSPDGRIFQLEYAQKAVENSGTAMGIKCSDGIVLAVGKSQGSKMLVPGSNRRIFGVDIHAGIAVTGFAPDGRQIVNRARQESASYRETYGHRMVPSVLADRISLFVHYCTLYGSLRPYGVASIIAAYDEDKKNAELYMVEPSGACYRYFGCAAGRGTNAAKTELEKLLNKYGNAGISCKQAVSELAKIIQLVRDQGKDKPLELEMSWICEESGWKHAMVPKGMVETANEAALDALAGSTSQMTIAESETSSQVIGAMEEKTMEIVDT